MNASFAQAGFGSTIVLMDRTPIVSRDWHDLFGDHAPVNMGHVKALYGRDPKGEVKQADLPRR